MSPRIVMRFYFKSKMIRRIVLDACMPSERWNFHLSFQEVATDHGLKHRFIEKYLLTKSPWNCTHPHHRLTQASKPFWKNSGLCSSSLSLLMVIYLETLLAQTLWDPKSEIIAWLDANKMFNVSATFWTIMRLSPRISSLECSRFAYITDVYRPLLLVL